MACVSKIGSLYELVTKRTTMMRSTIVEAAVDVADVRMGLTWVMVVEYTTTMARSMTAEWMS